MLFIEPTSIFSVNYTRVHDLHGARRRARDLRGADHRRDRLLRDPEPVRRTTAPGTSSGSAATAIAFALLLPRGLWGTLEARTGLRFMPLGYRVGAAGAACASRTADERRDARRAPRPRRARMTARCTSIRTQVAIVGAGPAGLTARAAARRRRHRVGRAREPQPRLRREADPRRRARAGHGRAARRRRRRRAHAPRGDRPPRHPPAVRRRAPSRPAQRAGRRAQHRRSTARPRSSRT